MADDVAADVDGKDGVVSTSPCSPFVGPDSEWATKIGQIQQYTETIYQKLQFSWPIYQNNSGGTQITAKKSFSK